MRYRGVAVMICSLPISMLLNQADEDFSFIEKRLSQDTAAYSEER